MDRTYVTKIRLPNGRWEKGPTVNAMDAPQAERIAKGLFALKHGYVSSDLDVRARRLDAKSVWPGGIDKEMCR